MPLTSKQMEYLALAWQCFETEPKIDYAKFSSVAGLASPASARELMRVTKNKLRDEYGALSSSTQARNSPAKTGVKTPVKSPVKTPGSKGKGKGAGSGGATPASKKRGKKLRDVEEGDDDDDDEEVIPAPKKRAKSGDSGEEKVEVQVKSEPEAEPEEEAEEVAFF